MIPTAKYALLPTMHGASADVLAQALTEMTRHYEGQETELANQLKWLGVLLRRAHIMPAQEQQEIQERLDMWDNLLEQDEHLQKIIARAVAKRAEEQTEKLAEERAEKLAEERAEKLAEERAEKLAEKIVEKEMAERLAEAEKRLAEEEAKARAEGEVQASQNILIDVVQTRFPPLVELAQRRAVQTKQPDALREVIRLISAAPDEATARWILSLTPAA